MQPVETNKGKVVHWYIIRQIIRPHLHTYIANYGYCMSVCTKGCRSSK